jgi:hypothetical protein
MMRLTSFLLAASTYLCSASPITGTHNGTISVSQTRDVKGIYVCSKPGWTGSCSWHYTDTARWKKCMPLKHADEIDGFGPDPNIIVRMNQDEACTKNRSPGFTWPGWATTKGLVFHDNDTLYGKKLIYVYVEGSDPMDMLTKIGKLPTNIEKGTGTW